MKKTYQILCILFILAGCEEQTDWDTGQSSPFLVGDCIITNELKRHIVNIYWSSDTLNQPVTGYAGATIELTDGSTTYSFSDGGNGLYWSDIPFRATAGKTYRLTVQHEWGADTAYAYLTGVRPLEDPVIRQEDGYFRYVVNPINDGYMLELYYDWSVNAGYCSQYGACAAMETYYVLDNIDLGKIFSPDRQQIVFPLNTTIIRKKFSLTVEHQEFARSLLLETEWRGGIFDAESGNVPTNFRNGMKGWFAACAMVSDTIRFER